MTVFPVAERCKNFFRTPKRSAARFLLGSSANQSLGRGGGKGFDISSRWMERGLLKKIEPPTTFFKKGLMAVLCRRAPAAGGLAARGCPGGLGFLTFPDRFFGVLRRPGTPPANAASGKEKARFFRSFYSVRGSFFRDESNRQKNLLSVSFQHIGDSSFFEFKIKRLFLLFLSFSHISSSFS